MMIGKINATVLLEVFVFFVERENPEMDFSCGSITLYVIKYFKQIGRAHV